MNKYLVLTAAALLSSATTVYAKVYCFGFTGSSVCDSGRITTGVDGGALNGRVRAWVHVNNNCTGATSQGYGMVAKVPGLGKVSLMSDDFFAKNYGSYSLAVSWTFPKKIANGQPWTLWIGMNGTTFFEGNSGVLLDVGECQNSPANHGRRSVLEGLKAILAARRQSAE